MRGVAAAIIAALLFVLLPMSSEAQQPDKVYRVGWLSTDRRLAPNPYIEAFRGGLGELGYIDGRNLAIEYRFAEGKMERLPALANELVRLKVDVIFAPTQPAALAASNTRGAIPIVFALVDDPVSLGLVASLRHPAGTVTGLSLPAIELDRRRLEFLKAVVPSLARVALFWNPAYSPNALYLPGLEDAAQSIGVRLQPVEVRGHADLERAFRATGEGRVGALMTLADPLTFSLRTEIAELAIRSRLPSMFYWRVEAEAGGLMSYGPDLLELYRRAATYVGRILSGARPGDLPIEEPGKFELVINLRTATALGLVIPEALLTRADRLIK